MEGATQTEVDQETSEEMAVDTHLIHHELPLNQKHHCILAYTQYNSKEMNLMPTNRLPLKQLYSNRTSKHVVDHPE